MDIYYTSNKLAKICNDQSLMDRKWGVDNAKKIRRRLNELAAANHLAEIPHTPPPRRHQLTGKKAGQFAVDIQQPQRIIFEPDHDPVPLSEDGGMDLTKITSIIILEVEDYHGKKK
ncbi:hypothetical protein G3A_02845 [Bacillus sp. 17376]|uniref:HigB toxin protein n=1 Tax=Mesobacillus boroniphilus JCM 21738 TaxID=1294265 RepID=W4RV02_9BACI|nr:hypothetical protein [Mesobacillus boroniphilus]ESU34097.1 hypothetical protein G3A_02845 [Bacillus sp. 17376]GAE48260.1 HigB toxin protein [Mesobacillus boroniphilus JCM 21738]